VPSSIPSEEFMKSEGCLRCIFVQFVGSPSMCSGCRHDGFGELKAASKRCVLASENTPSSVLPRKSRSSRGGTRKPSSHSNCAPPSTARDPAASTRCILASRNAPTAGSCGSWSRRRCENSPSRRRATETSLLFAFWFI